MGLVIAVATYIAVIYMGDSHPVIEKFEVTEFTQDWEPDKTYSKTNSLKLKTVSTNLLINIPPPKLSRLTPNNGRR